MRKIMGILEKATEQIELILDKGSFKGKYEIESIIRKAAAKLVYERNTELNKVLIEISNTIIDLSDLLMRDQDPQLLQQKMMLQYKKDILDKAIETRKSQGVKRSEPLERNYGLSPIFSGSLPNKETLVSLRNNYGHIVELRNGYRTVEFTAKHGEYLSPVDFKVFVAIQSLWEIKGGKKEFRFHLGELCEIVEGNKDGGTYDMIITSIKKLSTTSIVMEDYEDNNLRKKLKTRIHNLIQDAEIDYVNKTVHIAFNDYLHDGLQSGNFARISLSTFQDLSSKTAKLLYPFIISILSETNQIGIEELIIQLNLTDLPRNKAIERIKKSLNELIENDIIAEYDIVREGRSYKYVIITPVEDIKDGLKVINQ